MTAISTIKKLAASTAIAGSFGLAALSLGTAVAAAAPATDSGSSTSRASGTGSSGASRSGSSTSPAASSARSSSATTTTTAGGGTTSTSARPAVKVDNSPNGMGDDDEAPNFVSSSHAIYTSILADLGRELKESNRSLSPQQLRDRPGRELFVVDPPHRDAEIPTSVRDRLLEP
jgi:hypothetical protein